MRNNYTLVVNLLNLHKYTKVILLVYSEIVNGQIHVD